MAFEARTHVNGNMLRQFAGQNVSIMLCVDSEAGTNLIGTSTDDQKVTVQLSDSVGASKGDWIEVIGKAMGSTSVKAKEAILFGGENIDFDKEGYNMMVLFMNNCKEIYRSG
ncbi:uncharacterized protein LOC101895165 [Musca domestica]|uniref:Replication protein A 14 kDa subunit n=1 Tax=Musca domestica TaxID=7370 RepID=A0A1I8N0X1_MUSDO|nr:uncharacterized protein LOC101895165 [Musca domestica]XP_011295448.1 uncharacterized protein LOC101895165 [Musca domestica]